MVNVHTTLLRHGIKEARTLAWQDKNDVLCLQAAHAVMTDEEESIATTHAGFAMTALPHRRTTDTVWRRENGPLKLLIESGLDSSQKPVGIPYGATARMILLYLQSRAVVTRSRDVELGNSMHSWMTAMNMSKGGKTYKIIRDQAMRVSRCRLTFFARQGNSEMVSNGAFVRDAILPIDPSQPSLWQESVRLDEAFYQSLIEHALPLRDAALKEISGKSLAIDLYTWLAYRLHVLNQPVSISWGALRSQFGPEYQEIRYFRKEMLPQLRLALAVYPEARVSVSEEKGKEGLVLYPSAPPVRPRTRSIA